MSAPLPVLTVAVRQSAQSLTLACKVRAPTSVDYGVFHRIVDFYPDGAYRLSADTAYIEVVGDTLRIEKSCLAIPKELQVAEKSLPWAVKVPAGVEWEEEIRLTLPVRVCHPYRRAILAGKNPGADVNPEEPKTIRKIEVVYGVFPLGGDIQLQPISAAFPTVFDAWPIGEVLAKQVLISRPVPVPKEFLVLDYGVVPPIT